MKLRANPSLPSPSLVRGLPLAIELATARERAAAAGRTSESSFLLLATESARESEDEPRRFRTVE